MLAAILLAALAMSVIGWAHQRATLRRKAELDAVYRDAYEAGTAAWAPIIVAAEILIALAADPEA